MKFLRFLLVFSIFMSVFTLNAYSQGEYENRAEAVIVTECNTGTVLYSENEQERLPIASVTKLMCMLIWAEYIKAGELSFEDEITCSEYASSMDGSVIWLEPGETLTAGELIKSVVISSANDACVALCEHIAGSEEEFVSMMNSKASSLGMLNTHYQNCVGYDDDNHYSTAYDISILCGEFSQYNYYDTFFMTRLDYVREGERATQLLNTNKLIDKYEGLMGGKTGTTDNAGACLAVWAKRGNMTLCAVTLGSKESEERFTICRELLDYGFNGFEIYRPAVTDEMPENIQVISGMDKSTSLRVKQFYPIIIPKGRAGDIEYKYSTEPFLQAPVKSGHTAGMIVAYLDNNPVFTSDIVTVYEVEELTFINCFLMILREIFSF